MLKEGTVVKSTGSWYSVRITDSDQVMDCRIKGKFKLKEFQLTNPVAVGDKVVVDIMGDDNMIIEIQPRENYVVRQSPKNKHQLHLMASNIDQALVIVTIIEPMLKQGFIDRFLMMAAPYNIPVHIVFNKSDLYENDEKEVYQYLKEIYEKIGYTCHLVSSISDEGLDKLSEVLEGKTTLISGQSGVGKSSIINKLIPDSNLRTKEISDYSGKGQHTTTFAEMFTMPNGGYIIDTPGIKTLAFNHYEVMDIAHNFVELFEYSSSCKFGDCTHRNEPKCAVKDAIESGEISELRYANYLQLLEEVEDQNYWERNKDY